MTDTTYDIRCNLCGENRHSQIKRGVYGNELQNIYRCTSCGHLYLSPLLSDSEEERFYINEYPAFLLKRGEVGQLTPDEHFKKMKDEAIRRHRLVGQLLSKEQNVLEIGSATGFFLEHIKGAVKSVQGVEPNQAYCGYADGRGIPTCTDLRELGDRKYDVVFLYYVLEHVKEPVAFMKSIKSVLKNADSKIVIEVPNADEALVSLYGPNAYDDFVWQRAHCSYFKVETLKKLFAMSDLFATFVPVQRYDLSNHMHWLAKGKPGGMGKYTDVFSAALDSEYKKCLEKKWVCDSILAIASQAEGTR